MLHSLQFQKAETLQIHYSHNLYIKYPLVMNNCLKFYWVICLYGVIFFTFTAITFHKAPQYYDFSITDEVKNSQIILIMLYLLSLVVLSVKWRRDNKLYKDQERNIEMKPLRSMEEHRGQEEEIDLD